MVGGSDGVLREGCVVIAVGVGRVRPETLQIILRDGVGVGAERGEWEPGFHRFEGEGIDLDDIEEIFAALLAGVVIVEQSNEGIAAELERMATGIEAQGFGKLAAMFAGGARELVGAANTVDEVGNFNQSVGGVGI